jgi:hypothetical protein
MVARCPRCGHQLKAQLERKEIPYPGYLAIWKTLRYMPKAGQGATQESILKLYSAIYKPGYIKNALTWLRKNGYIRNVQQGVWVAIK